MTMTPEEYFKFLIKEQEKTVREAAKKDGKESVYVFYGYYGKVVWSFDGTRWSHEIQPLRTSKS